MKKPEYSSNPGDWIEYAEYLEKRLANLEGAISSMLGRTRTLLLESRSLFNDWIKAIHKGETDA